MVANFDLPPFLFVLRQFLPTYDCNPRRCQSDASRICAFVEHKVLCWSVTFMAYDIWLLCSREVVEQQNKIFYVLLSFCNGHQLVTCIDSLASTMKLDCCSFW